MSFIKKAGVLLLFSLCFLFPELSAEGSKNGLCLWYEKLLPVLFPGMLFGGLIKRTGLSNWIIQKFYPFFVKIFPCSYSALFVIFTGFFCGYPMAAILSNKAWQRGEITEEEFHYCMSFANLPGPVFLSGFVLKDTENRYLWMAVFYGTAVLIAQISRFCFLSGKRYQEKSESREDTPFFLAFQEEIYQAATTLIQIAAILMICSMIICYGKVLFPSNILSFVIGFFEMSTGIVCLSGISGARYELFALFIAGFGGLSVLLQIFTVAQGAMKNTRYSLVEYLVFKALFLFVFVLAAKGIILR